MCVCVCAVTTHGSCLGMKVALVVVVVSLCLFGCLPVSFITQCVLVLGHLTLNCDLLFTH